MTVIFRAGGQLLKVRGLMLLSLACAAGSLWWGWDLFQTYGSRPADGGVLAPLPVRLLWGVGVGSLGVLFAAGMWLYGRVYVARMELDQKAGKLHVRTLRFLGTRDRVFDVSDVVGSSQHKGKLDLVGAPSVNAPWTGVRIAGMSLPLIVDGQGEFPEPELSDRLLGSGARGARR